MGANSSKSKPASTQVAPLQPVSVLVQSQGHSNNQLPSPSSKRTSLGCFRQLDVSSAQGPPVTHPKLESSVPPIASSQQFATSNCLPTNEPPCHGSSSPWMRGSSAASFTPYPTSRAGSPTSGQVKGILKTNAADSAESERLRAEEEKAEAVHAERMRRKMALQGSVQLVVTPPIFDGLSMSPKPVSNMTPKAGSLKSPLSPSVQVSNSGFKKWDRMPAGLGSTVMANNMATYDSTELATMGDLDNIPMFTPFNPNHVLPYSSGSLSKRNSPSHSCDALPGFNSAAANKRRQSSDSNLVFYSRCLRDNNRHEPSQMAALSS